MKSGNCTREMMVVWSARIITFLMDILDQRPGCVTPGVWCNSVSHYRVMYRIRSISDCHSTCQLMMSSGENHCYDVMWKGNISMRTFLFLYMLLALGDRGYQKWVWSEITDGWWGDDTWPDMITCYWYDGRHEAAPGVHNGLIARWRHTEPQSGTTSMNIEGIRYINILFIDKFIPFIEVRWSKLIVEKIFI